MLTTIYGVTLKGDNTILGLAWTEKQANKLVANVNNTFAPHTIIGDYEIVELMLPPFRNWITEKFEDLGLEMPDSHIVYHQDKSSDPAFALLQAFLGSITDPLPWAMKMIEAPGVKEALGMTVSARERVEAMMGD
jgi:hypothetical protein